MPRPRPVASTPRQGTRMMKVVCGECGYTLRTTRRWLAVAVPVCPGSRDHGEMDTPTTGARP